MIVDESVYRGDLEGPWVNSVLQEWVPIYHVSESRRILPYVGMSPSIQTTFWRGISNRPAGGPAFQLCSWHDFRHTFTTWNRRAGVPPEVVRDQLGHTSVATSMDIYSRLEDGTRAPSVESYAKAGWGKWNPTGARLNCLTGLVGASGFEPPASWSRTSRYQQLTSIAH